MRWKEPWRYGDAPEVIGTFEIASKELMFVLYMPIRLPGGSVAILPPHLAAYRPLVNAALTAEQDLLCRKYVYLTVKRLYVEPGNLGGRLGWHTDGFGTEDVNYIWCDKDPTEFCVQPFDLSDDHLESMVQMEQQARPENIITLNPFDLVRIDARHVHRCPETPVPGFRTFARISFSDARYDLEGNAHNYSLDYDWPMYRRGEERNDTSAGEHR